MTPNDACQTLLELCQRAPVMPVLVCDDASVAGPLAEALVGGGLPVLEVTLRTPSALGTLRRMTEVNGAVVGVGSLKTAADVRRAKDAGAAFGVSPGTTDALLEACEEVGLPLLPGAITASEAMALLARGYSVQKFFPAEASGGVAALRALAGPLPEVTFCPTGGIGSTNAADYLKLGNVCCVGGSWVATRQLVAEHGWGKIRDLARQASALGWR